MVVFPFPIPIRTGQMELGAAMHRGTIPTGPRGRDVSGFCHSRPTFGATDVTGRGVTTRSCSPACRNCALRWRVGTLQADEPPLTITPGDYVADGCSNLGRFCAASDHQSMFLMR